MRKLPPRLMFWATLTIALGMVIWAMIRSTAIKEVTRVGFQDADRPLDMPAEGGIDFRFMFPSAWHSAAIPLATRFDMPMGSASGALTYNAQPFMEMNEARGGRHTGDDLNGIGGMNSDHGDPVFSIADGLVVYAGEPSSGWGKTVITSHRTTDGRTLQAMYSHLDRLDVVAGHLVPRGKMIGAVGTGNDHYPAHLHFEIRESDYIDMDSGYADQALNRLNPMATIESLRNAAADELSPSALAIVMKAEGPSWTDLKIENAEKLYQLREEE